MQNTKNMKSTQRLRANKGKGVPYHKKSYSSVNPILDEYSTFNRKMNHKIKANPSYGAPQVSAGSKSRIEKEK